MTIVKLKNTVTISGDLVVEGELKFNGGEKLENKLRQLLEKIDLLEKKFEKIDLLEDKVEQIYYAPGMPGYILAQESFNSLCCGQ